MDKEIFFPANPASEDKLKELGFCRYTGSVPFDQLEFPEEPVPADYVWAVNDPELQKKYSGQVVAVRHRVIWGVGKSYQAAWENARAQPGCPAAAELVFVVI